MVQPPFEFAEYKNQRSLFLFIFILIFTFICIYNFLIFFFFSRMSKHTWTEPSLVVVHALLVGFTAYMVYRSCDCHMIYHYARKPPTGRNRPGKPGRDQPGDSCQWYSLHSDLQNIKIRGLYFYFLFTFILIFILYVYIYNFQLFFFLFEAPPLSYFAKPQCLVKFTALRN